MYRLLLADPTEEEERLSGHAVTVIVDQHGNLAGVTKVGGSTLSDAELQRCVAGAAARNRELRGALGL